MIPVLTLTDAPSEAGVDLCKSLVEELTNDTHFPAAAHPLGIVVREHCR